jgi:hypothetical protein
LENIKNKSKKYDCKEDNIMSALHWERKREGARWRKQYRRFPAKTHWVNFAIKVGSLYSGFCILSMHFSSMTKTRNMGLPRYAIFSKHPGFVFIKAEIVMNR